MVMAIDLYEETAPPEYCPYTTLALKKLRQFVEDRKEMTAQSYRFFVEHAYSQFFQHEAFHQSATARTRAKDLGAGELQTSTKLEGYVWIAGEKKMTRVPKDQADDVQMQDDDESDEELDELPRLQVIVKSKEKKEEKSGSSSEKEEPQVEEVHDEEEEVLPEIAPIREPMDRYGQFLVNQLSPAHQRLLYELTLSSQNVLRGDDLEGRPPLQRGDISYTCMEMMVEFLAFESFNNFMTLYGPTMQFEVSYDDYHVLHLSPKEILENNRHIKVSNFEDVEEPDLADDNPETPLPCPGVQTNVSPEYKDSVEHLSRESKHIILETDDDDLVECTIKWLNMCNKNPKKKIIDRVVKTESKEEQAEDEEEVEVEVEGEEELHDPKIPAPTTATMECQTDESFLSGTKPGSS